MRCILGRDVCECNGKQVLIWLECPDPLVGHPILVKSIDNWNRRNPIGLSESNLTWAGGLEVVLLCCTRSSAEIGEILSVAAGDSKHTFTLDSNLSLTDRWFQ